MFWQGAIAAPLLVLNSHAMGARGYPTLYKTALHITHQAIITYIHVLHDEGGIHAS